MNGYLAVAANADRAVEAFAAELTDAAYGVALRHGTADGWLDMELALWNAMTEVVRARADAVLAGQGAFNQ